MRYYGKKAEAQQVMTAISEWFPSALVYHDIAAGWYDMGEIDKALDYFDKAICLDKNDADSHYGLAYCLMSSGELQDGFKEYLWRSRKYGTPKTLDHLWPKIPKWYGEDLNGKTILVWTEQGVGDEILLSSLLPDLFEKNARVILVCTGRVADLLRLTFPDITYVLRQQFVTELEDGQPEVTADFQAGLSELGHELRPSFAAFPVRPNGWLKHDEAKAAELRAKYRDGTQQPVVGIAWESGNPLTGKQKSTELTSWLPILRVPGIKFVSLQHRCDWRHVQNVNDIAKHTVGHDPLLYDGTVLPHESLVQYASQVAACDLVISVSGTAVHVAGALGVPVWNIVPDNQGCIWYWFRNRTDSPWYATMKIIRNKRIFYTVAEQIEGTLKAFMEKYNVA